MDFRDNEVLIEQLKNGEEKAYMYLCDTYYRRLSAYAQSLIHDHALAEDIVQNVFIKTWKFRKKLKPDFSLQGFLYRSVYNEFLDTYRKNRAVTLLEQKYIESLNQIVNETEDVAMDKMIALVKKEVQELPQKCKRIFNLSKEDGLTNIEIAEYLDISIKTVEYQMTKAYKILRNKLSDQYEIVLFFLFHASGNYKKHP